MTENNTLINRFIDYINQDFSQLLRYMEKKNVLTEIIKDKYERYDNELVIHYDSFIRLYDECCFETKKLENKPLDPEFVERLELFDKLFFKTSENNILLTFHNLYGRKMSSQKSYFFCLLYAIFIENLYKKKSIREIFQELWDEWNLSLSKKLMKIQILIPLPRFTKAQGSLNNISITDDINVKWNIMFDLYKIRRDSLSNEIIVSNLIIYSTEIPFDLYLSKQEQKERYKKNLKRFEQARVHLSKKIQEIIAAFYLSGVQFDFNQYYYFLPWWFKADHKLYKKIERKIDKEVVISQKNLTNVIELYPKIVKCRLFYDDKYIILSHHYMQLINRIFFPDVFLDAFIILEFILTRNVPSEVTYRISINAGFFLGSNFKEFESIYKLMKDLYGIRSKMVHGSKWHEKMNKIVRKYDGFGNQQDLFHYLIQLVDSCIIKLITLMQSTHNILEKLDDFYIIKTSNVINKKD